MGRSACCAAIHNAQREQRKQNHDRQQRAECVRARKREAHAHRLRD
jgi:hypothetical protein